MRYLLDLRLFSHFWNY